MYATCPHCKTVYAVTLDQLAAANGMVRCSLCLTAFDADETLLYELPETPLSDDPLSEDTGARKKIQGEGHPAPVQADTDRPESRETVSNGPRFSGPDSVFPLGIALSEAAPRPAKSWLWGTGSLAMAVLLVFQLAYFQRTALARNPSIRPWIESLCVLAQCELPPRRDLSKLELLSRNIYSHPNARDALIVSVSLVNNAAFEQPYPVLILTLSDVRGNLIAKRQFPPSSYLPAAASETVLPPGAPKTILLEVTDPGSDALTFELDFG